MFGTPDEKSPHAENQVTIDANIKEIAPVTIDGTTYRYRVRGILYAETKEAAKYGYEALNTLPKKVRALLKNDAKNGLLLLIDQSAVLKSSANNEKTSGIWIFHGSIKEQLAEGRLRLEGRGVETKPLDGYILRIGYGGRSLEVLKSIFSHESGHHLFYRTANKRKHAKFDFDITSIRFVDPLFGQSAKVIRQFHVLYWQDVMQFLMRSGGWQILPPASPNELASIEYLMFTQPIDRSSAHLSASMKHLLKQETYKVDAHMLFNAMNKDNPISYLTEALHQQHPQLKYKDIRKAVIGAARMFRVELGAYYIQAAIMYPETIGSICPGVCSILNPIIEERMASISLDMSDPADIRLNSVYQAFKLSKVSSPFVLQKIQLNTAHLSSLVGRNVEVISRTKAENKKLFGISRNPILYAPVRADNIKEFSAQIKNITLVDIRAIENSARFFYVITNNGELIISPKAADMQAVVAAGEVFIKNGRIYKMVPLGGLYLITDPHQKIITEHVFIRNGFEEALSCFNRVTHLLDYPTYQSERIRADLSFGNLHSALPQEISQSDISSFYHRLSITHRPKKPSQLFSLESVKPDKFKHHNGFFHGTSKADVEKVNQAFQSIANLKLGVTQESYQDIVKRLSDSGYKVLIRNRPLLLEESGASLLGEVAITHFGEATSIKPECTFIAADNDISVLAEALQQEIAKIAVREQVLRLDESTYNRLVESAEQDISALESMLEYKPEILLQRWSPEREQRGRVEAGEEILIISRKDYYEVGFCEIVGKTSRYAEIRLNQDHSYHKKLIDQLNSLDKKHFGNGAINKSVAISLQHDLINVINSFNGQAFTPISHISPMLPRVYESFLPFQSFVYRQLNTAELKKFITTVLSWEARYPGLGNLIAPSSTAITVELGVSKPPLRPEVLFSRISSGTPSITDTTLPTSKKVRSITWQNRGVVTRWPQQTFISVPWNQWTSHHYSPPTYTIEWIDVHIGDLKFVVDNVRSQNVVNSVVPRLARNPSATFQHVLEMSRTASIQNELHLYAFDVAKFADDAVGLTYCFKNGHRGVFLQTQHSMGLYAEMAHELTHATLPLAVPHATSDPLYQTYAPKIREAICADYWDHRTKRGSLVPIQEKVARWIFSMPHTYAITDRLPERLAFTVQGMVESEMAAQSVAPRTCKVVAEYVAEQASISAAVRKPLLPAQNPVKIWDVNADSSMPCVVDYRLTPSQKQISTSSLVARRNNVPQLYEPITIDIDVNGRVIKVPPIIQNMGGAYERWQPWSVIKTPQFWIKGGSIVLLGFGVYAEYQAEKRANPNQIFAEHVWNATLNTGANVVGWAPLGPLAIPVGIFHTGPDVLPDFHEAIQNCTDHSRRLRAGKTSGNVIRDTVDDIVLLENAQMLGGIAAAQELTRPIANWCDRNSQRVKDLFSRLYLRDDGELRINVLVPYLYKLSKERQAQRTQASTAPQQQRSGSTFQTRAEISSPVAPTNDLLPSFFASPQSTLPGTLVTPVSPNPLMVTSPLPSQPLDNRRVATDWHAKNWQQESAFPQQPSGSVNGLAPSICSDGNGEQLPVPQPSPGFSLKPAEENRNFIRNAAQDNSGHPLGSFPSPSLKKFPKPKFPKPKESENVESPAEIVGHFANPASAIFNIINQANVRTSQSKKKAESQANQKRQAERSAREFDIDIDVKPLEQSTQVTVHGSQFNGFVPAGSGNGWLAPSSAVPSHDATFGGQKQVTPSSDLVTARVTNEMTVSNQVTPAPVEKREALPLATSSQAVAKTSSRSAHHEDNLFLQSDRGYSVVKSGTEKSKGWGELVRQSYHGPDTVGYRVGSHDNAAGIDFHIGFELRGADELGTKVINRLFGGDVSLLGKENKYDHTYSRRLEHKRLKKLKHLSRNEAQIVVKSDTGVKTKIPLKLKGFNERSSKNQRAINKALDQAMNQAVNKDIIPVINNLYQEYQNCLAGDKPNLSGAQAVLEKLKRFQDIPDIHFEIKKMEVRLEFLAIIQSKANKKDQPEQPISGQHKATEIASTPTTQNEQTLFGYLNEKYFQPHYQAKVTNACQAVADRCKVPKQERLATLIEKNIDVGAKQVIHIDTRLPIKHEVTKCETEIKEINGTLLWINGKSLDEVPQATMDDLYNTVIKDKLTSKWKGRDARPENISKLGEITNAAAAMIQDKRCITNAKTEQNLSDLMGLYNSVSDRFGAKQIILGFIKNLLVNMVKSSDPVSVQSAINAMAEMKFAPKEFKQLPVDSDGELTSLDHAEETEAREAAEQVMQEYNAQSELWLKQCDSIGTAMGNVAELTKLNSASQAAVDQDPTNPAKKLYHVAVQVYLSLAKGDSSSAVSIINNNAADHPEWISVVCERGIFYSLWQRDPTTAKVLREAWGKTVNKQAASEQQPNPTAQASDQPNAALVKYTRANNRFSPIIAHLTSPSPFSSFAEVREHWSKNKADPELSALYLNALLPAQHNAFLELEGLGVNVVDAISSTGSHSDMPAVRFVSRLAQAGVLLHEFSPHFFGNYLFGNIYNDGNEQDKLKALIAEIAAKDPNTLIPLPQVVADHLPFSSIPLEPVLRVVSGAPQIFGYNPEWAQSLGTVSSAYGVIKKCKAASDYLDFTSTIVKFGVPRIINKYKKNYFDKHKELPEGTPYYLANLLSSPAGSSSISAMIGVYRQLTKRVPDKNLAKIYAVAALVLSLAAVYDANRDWYINIEHLIRKGELERAKTRIKSITGTRKTYLETQIAAEEENYAQVLRLTDNFKSKVAEEVAGMAERELEALLVVKPPEYRLQFERVISSVMTQQTKKDWWSYRLHFQDGFLFAARCRYVSYKAGAELISNKSKDDVYDLHEVLAANFRDWVSSRYSKLQEFLAESQGKKLLTQESNAVVDANAPKTEEKTEKIQAEYPNVKLIKDLVAKEAYSELVDQLLLLHMMNVFNQKAVNKEKDVLWYLAILIHLLNSPKPSVANTAWHMLAGVKVIESAEQAIIFKPAKGVELPSIFLSVEPNNELVARLKAAIERANTRVQRNNKLRDNKLPKVVALQKYAYQVIASSIEKKALFSIAEIQRKFPKEYQQLNTELHSEMASSNPELSLLESYQLGQLAFILALIDDEKNLYQGRYIDLAARHGFEPNFILYAVLIIFGGIDNTNIHKLTSFFNLYDLSLVEKIAILRQLLALMVSPDYTHEKFNDDEILFKKLIVIMRQVKAGINENLNKQLVDKVQKLTQLAATEKESHEKMTKEIVELLRKGADPDQVALYDIFSAGEGYKTASQLVENYLIHDILMAEKVELVRIFKIYGADFTKLNLYDMNVAEWYVADQVNSPNAEPSLAKQKILQEVINAHGIDPNLTKAGFFSVNNCFAGMKPVLRYVTTLAIGPLRLLDTHFGDKPYCVSVPAGMYASWTLVQIAQNKGIILPLKTRFHYPWDQQQETKAEPAKQQDKNTEAQNKEASAAAPEAKGQEEAPKETKEAIKPEKVLSDVLCDLERRFYKARHERFVLKLSDKPFAPQGLSSEELANYFEWFLQNKFPPAEFEYISLKIALNILAQMEIIAGDEKYLEAMFLKIQAKFIQINLFRTVDDQGDYPIHHAVRGGHGRFVEWMLSIDPDLANLQNHAGKKPIDMVSPKDLSDWEPILSLKKDEPSSSLASSKTNEEKSTETNANTQSKSTPPVEEKPVGPQKTRAEGDCAFDAIFGEWNAKEGQYECKDVKAKRKEVAEKIRACKPGDPIYSLVQRAIEDMVMNGRSNKGSIGQISQLYEDHAILKNVLRDSAWENFEKKLLENKNIMTFINGQNLPAQDSLKARFHRCLNLQEGVLYGLIKSVPELDEAFERYNVVAKEGFDWNGNLKDRKAIEQYACLIAMPRYWLLRHELGIIAYALEITVDLYSARAASKETYNPGQKKSVAVWFDGLNHYQHYIPPVTSKQAENTSSQLANGSVSVADEKIDETTGKPAPLSQLLTDTNQDSKSDSYTSPQLQEQGVTQFRRLSSGLLYPHGRFFHTAHHVSTTSNPVADIKIDEATKKPAPALPQQATHLTI